MSIRAQFAALGEALTDDLRTLSPYQMAAIAGYGRVKGYAPVYAELRVDIFEFLDICRDTLDGLDFSAPDDLPPLVRHRMMCERFFIQERDTLTRALISVIRRARSASEAMIAGSFAAADPMRRDQLGYLLRRANVSVEQAPKGRPATPQSRRKPVYVTTHFSPELGDHVAKRLYDTDHEQAPSAVDATPNAPHAAPDQDTSSPAAERLRRVASSAARSTRRPPRPSMMRLIERGLIELKAENRQAPPAATKVGFARPERDDHSAENVQQRIGSERLGARRSIF